MKTYLIKFTGSALEDQWVHASGYKLLHGSLVLSFHDAEGLEVFATDIRNVTWWRPAEMQPTVVGQRLNAPVSVAPPYSQPPADPQGRPSGGTIGDQVAADLQRQPVGA